MLSMIFVVIKRGRDVPLLNFSAGLLILALIMVRLQEHCK